MNETAYHEAGHCVQAWAYDLEISTVSIRSNEPERRAGGTSFKSADEVSDVNFVAILLAGQIAQNIASGRPADFDWLAVDGPSGDADKARWFIDRLPDPMRARLWAELKAKTGLMIRWDAVARVAAALERKTMILGDEVDRLIRTTGAMKVGHRPFDPDKHLIVVEGHRISMRKWADLVAASGFNVSRARKALARCR